jgi:type IV secretion system protein VirD4
VVAGRRRHQLGRGATHRPCDDARRPALGRGTQHEQHWSERAGALLAPLLHAAHTQGEPIETVLGWVLRHELEPANKILARNGATIAVDVLLGIGKTDTRERSSIFSASAGVLALYNTDAARKAAANPNFDPDQFAHSTDTIYITAPAHRQALCAPLVVGLLEQIRHATYRRAARNPGGTPVFFCLDELANIAPIPDLPALASEAGGQGLHLMACLQDLSQARTRWSDAAADGFLTLFQTKLLLPAISDPHALEALSLILGEIDRPMPNRSTGLSRSRTGWTGPTTITRSQTDGYTVTRQRRLPPGEIAAIPPGQALLIQGTTHQRLRLAPHHTTQPWRTLTQTPTPPLRPHRTVGNDGASYAEPGRQDSGSDRPAAHRSQS